MSPLRMIATLYLVLSVGSCGWSEDTASFVQSIPHPRITDTKAAATDLEEQPTRDEKKWRPALKRLPHAHQRSVHDIQFQLPRSVEPHENIDDFRDVAAQKCVVWTPARVRYGSIQFRDESLEREGEDQRAPPPAGDIRTSVHGRYLDLAAGKSFALAPRVPLVESRLEDGPNSQGSEDGNQTTNYSCDPVVRDHQRMCASPETSRRIPGVLAVYFRLCR